MTLADITTELSKLQARRKQVAKRAARKIEARKFSHCRAWLKSAAIRRSAATLT